MNATSKTAQFATLNQTESNATSDDVDVGHAKEEEERKRGFFIHKFAVTGESRH